MSNKRAMLLILAWVIIVLGLVPWPLAMVPVLIFLSVGLLPVRLHPAITFVLAFVIVLLGVGLTAAIAAFSGPGAKLISVAGLCLTIVLASSVLLLTRSPARRVAAPAAVCGIALATVAAIWSLAAVVAVIYQANKMSQGLLFCLAAHGENSQVKSFAELRGFRFFTSKTGYKSTSQWYFHGVLVVAKNDSNNVSDQNYFNWSPRRWHFTPVSSEPARHVRVRGSCAPNENFWSTLRVF